MTLNSNFRHYDSNGLSTGLRLCNALWVALMLLYSSCSVAQTSGNKAFIDAMALVENGEWRAAKIALKAQLKENPNFHRARVELALVYIQINQIDQAREEFDYVLSQPNIPPNVRSNIEHMRAQLDSITVTKTPTHSFESSLSFALGYDDNVRFSGDDYFLDEDPYRDGIFVELNDGLVIYISPDGFAFDIEGNRIVELDGVFDRGERTLDNMLFEGTFDLGHRYQFGEQSEFDWHTDIRIQATENNEFSQFDKLQLRVKTGLGWRLSETVHSEFNLHHRVLQRDGQLQVRATTLESLTSFYTNSGQFSVGYEYMKRRYEDGSFINGDFETLFFGFETNTHSVMGKWSRLFADGNVLLVGQVQYIDSNSSDGFDYKGIKGSLSTTIKVTTDIHFSASATQLVQDYSEIADYDLEDETMQLKSRLSYVIKDDLSLFVSFERGLRSSDIYGGIKSQKSAVQLGIEYQF